MRHELLVLQVVEIRKISLNDRIARGQFEHQMLVIVSRTAL
jgi:hypothetical protein